MKKVTKYGVTAAVSVAIGCGCIGLGMGLGMKMERSKAEIPAFTQQDSSEIPESMKPISTSQVSITKVESDPYEKNKRTAKALKAEYEEEQRLYKENEEKNRTEWIENLKNTYQQDRDSYLIEISQDEILTNHDYMLLDTELLQIARNEVYARHGYIFKDENYKQIFSNKSWYTPVTSNMEEIQLSDVERYNVQCLKWWEEVQYDYEEYLDFDIEGFTECYEFAQNQTFTMDLNGDGIQEEISYKFITDVEDDTIASCSIEINGQLQLTKEGFWEPYLWVVDIDAEDEYKELILFDHGLSSDPVDSYYYYDGEELIFMGSVSGHLNSEDYIEDGIVHAIRRFDILGTKYYRWDYELTDEHLLQEIGYEYAEANIPVIAQEEIGIYTQADIHSKKSIYERGTSFIALGSDLKEWIKVKLQDGSEGWINTYEYPEYQLGGLVFYD